MFYCGYMIRTKEHLEKHLSDCWNGASLIHYNTENKKEPTMNEARLISSINRKWKQESTSVISAMYNNHGMHRVFTHSKSLKLDG